MHNETRTEIKPVLFVLTSHGQKGNSGDTTGYYLAEVTHPLAVLEEAGIPVEFASVKGGKPPVDGLDLSEPTNERYWNDPKFQAAVQHTEPLSDVQAQRYSAVLFAGGHGTMWDFPENSDVQRIAREIFENGGLVAAVCHGPSALVNVKLTDGTYLVAGRNVSAFTDAEEHAVGLDKTVPFLLASRLTERGAIHQAAPDWTCNVVVDGKLITGQNPQSASGLGTALRDLLLNIVA